MAGPLEFASKQSDYWFIEETDEFLVCTVTSVSADFDGCYGDLVSIYPMLHKINRKTNKTTYLFPPTTAISAISANDTYVYSTVPDISANVAIQEISKPIISYNEKTDYYNVTFLGKYTDKDISIFTYNFQYAEGLMHLLDSHVIVPESKNPEAKFTFEDGYIHKDYIVDGITTAGFNSNVGLLFPYFSGGEIPPNYKIRPWHENNNLVFSKAIYATDSTELTGNSALPIGYSGGYITQKSAAKALETDGVMRVEFTYKCFNLDAGAGASNTLLPFVTGAWEQTSNNPISASRGIATSSVSLVADNYGEGFCVFFYEPNSEEFPVQVIDDNIGVGTTNIVGIGATSYISDPDNRELTLNGYGSGIGYSPASATYLEYSLGSPNQFRIPGIKAKGYLGICFDISGLFCTTDSGKPGAFTGTGLDTAVNTSYRKTIGVRAGYRQKYQALFRSGNISSIDLHEVVTAYANATSKDIRIDIRNGTDVRIYGKVSTDSAWISLYNFNLANYYDRVPKFLKAGLSFSTSDKVSNFELQKFRVQGVQTDTPSIPDVITSGSPVSPNVSKYDTTVTGLVQSCSNDPSQLCNNTTC